MGIEGGTVSKWHIISWGELWNIWHFSQMIHWTCNRLFLKAHKGSVHGADWFVDGKLFYLGKLICNKRWVILYIYEYIFVYMYVHTVCIYTWPRFVCKCCILGGNPCSFYCRDDDLVIWAPNVLTIMWYAARLFFRKFHAVASMSSSEVGILDSIWCSCALDLEIYWKSAIRLYHDVSQSTSGGNPLVFPGVLAHCAGLRTDSAEGAAWVGGLVGTSVGWPGRRHRKHRNM